MDEDVQGKVEVVIDSIRVSLMSQQRIVMLKYQEGTLFTDLDRCSGSRIDCHSTSRSGSCASIDPRFAEKGF